VGVLMGVVGRDGAACDSGRQSSEGNEAEAHVK
jgi:hypothetical protein